jgi:RHS repeat-associated protein
VWEHIYLGDLPVAVIASGGGVFPVLSDHLGTPRQIINASKQLRWQWDNTEPFGANAANQNPAGFGVFAYNLRFPGQYFDVETGLHYNYFRDYNPQTGRYVESDPIGLSGGLNTFGYARNNPLRFIDPSGHIAVVDDAIIIGGGAAAVTACIAMNCGQGVVDTASKVADAVSDAMHDALDNIYEMSKSGQTSKGTNWATEAAKVKTQEDGQDPCYWLAKWLAEAKASGDKKRVGDLIEAEKYMDCRNKDKRKNKYRCE